MDRPPRILICSVQIPFVSGGAERHIESLHRELLQRGFETDVVRLPFKWYPPRQIINDCLAWRFLDLTASYGLPVDMVIGTRFPSYIIQHPCKIAWILHQHRQAYDLLTSEFTDFKDKSEDDEVRSLIYKMDRRALLECRHIFANSINVSTRLKKYLDLDSEPLYHPPPLAGSYYCAEYGTYVLSVGRLELNKRVELLLQALAKTRNPVQAVIAGSGPQRSSLEQLTADLGIADRVQFTGFVDDHQLLKLYAECGAVYYAPLDEDYGYVTLEAFLSGKTVITAKDSGGVLEFASDRETALVADSNPASIAIALDEWWMLPDRGKSLGMEGQKRIVNVSWDTVIQRLTACLSTR